MSRVRDALRRAGQGGISQPHPPVDTPEVSARGQAVEPASEMLAGGEPEPAPKMTVAGSWLEKVQEVPFNPAPEALLIDSARPQEAPSEEFRSLRTRLNHLQTLEPIHCVVFTSPSPAEGKSFAAANLALAESHMAGNLTLLVDLDFRRPVLHSLFQIDRTPGATDYLMGDASLQDVVRHISGTNLYIIPAGRPVKNPLELLNLDEVKRLIQELPKTFNWVILDSPPLLFSADANLLGTLTDGTILVVRIGQTTIDTVNRSMQTLCENKVLGIVVNGARAGELYSKYTYYYSRYGHHQESEPEQVPQPAQAEEQ